MEMETSYSSLESNTSAETSGDFFDGDFVLVEMPSDPVDLLIRLPQVTNGFPGINQSEPVI